MSGGEPLRSQHLEGRQISEFKASLDDILIKFSARQDYILKLSQQSRKKNFSL